MSSNPPRQYIAFDGEGETRHHITCGRGYDCDCPHYYCLLAWSLGPGKANGYAYNPDGIPTIDAVEFIWSVLRRFPRHQAVMYSASYDFNCCLRNLDRRRAQWLWDEQPIRVGEFLVQYNHRTLIIKRGRRQVEVADVWRFYQGRFVKALENNLPDYAGLEEITLQKNKRSEFSFVAEFKSILHYCLQEIEALVLLMHKLDADLEAAGIGRTRLNGAGSVAAKMMQMHHVKQHRPSPKSPDYRTVWPEAVEAASYYAYSAGRIEPWKFGYHQGVLYVYDLRSAYPRAMCDLPSLVNGSWERDKDFGCSEQFALYQVRFDASRNARGFPFFQRIKNGGILYPSSVQGWYWQPEVVAARECGFEFEIVDGYAYHPTSDVKPFAFIPELFARRAALKAAGQMGPQEIIKLGLNSLYGKLCQTVGGTADAPPPFHQMGWAGYVTARTRAEVFKVAMQRPDDVVFIATDGVASIRPLEIAEGTGLGEWEASTYDGALVVQAGVYFLWKDDVCIPKYRGFDKDAIKPQAIVDAWKQGQTVMDVPSTRFITLGSALEAHWNRWANWRTIPRQLELTGGDGKREWRRPNNGEPWRELCDLEPYSLPEVRMSMPYEPQWKDIAKEKLDHVLLTTYENEIVAIEGVGNVAA